MSSQLGFLYSITEYLKYNIVDIQNEKIKLSEITWDRDSAKEYIEGGHQPPDTDLTSLRAHDLVFNDLPNYILQLFVSIFPSDFLEDEVFRDESSIKSHRVSGSEDSTSSNADRATLSSFNDDSQEKEINKLSLIIEKAIEAFELLKQKFTQAHSIPDSIQGFLEYSLPIIFKMCMRNYFYYIQNLDFELNELQMENDRVQNLTKSRIEISNAMYCNMIKSYFYLYYQKLSANCTLQHPKAHSNSSTNTISFEECVHGTVSRELDLNFFEFLTLNRHLFPPEPSGLTFPTNLSKMDKCKSPPSLIPQFLELIKKYKPEYSEQISLLLYKALSCQSNSLSNKYFSIIGSKLRPWRTIYECYMILWEIISKEGCKLAYLNDLTNHKIFRSVTQNSNIALFHKKSTWWSTFTKAFSKRSLLKSILCDFIDMNSTPQFYILLSKINDWSNGHISRDSLCDIIDSLPDEINKNKKSDLKYIIDFEEYQDGFFNNYLNQHMQKPIYHPFVPLTQQEHWKWERSESNSYKRLPPDMPKILCSGRYDNFVGILNDEWVSVPEKLESTPKHLNPHEEALFKIEDLRYTADIKISRVLSLLKSLNLAQINIKVQENLKSKALPILQTDLTPIHKSILREIYGLHTNHIIDSVCREPSEHLPILIACLEEKLFEWINAKQNIDTNVWRASEQSHWCNLLDPSPKSMNTSGNNKRYFTRSSGNIEFLYRPR